ncbi:MAG: WecB/TagA/CpsF family glycosyltransferase [Anaerolineales bacterium]|nr:WecB/TagA/CpsF family glycosyltransferase [Anaerolineales bacterium]
MSNIPSPSRRLFLSVPVHDVTYAETLDWIARAVAADEPRQLCTVNPEFVMTAQTHAEFRRVLQNADICLPDGQGLLWAARWRGVALRERVAGSTLLGRLAQRAATHGWRMFFLGAAPGVAARAAAILEQKHPGLLKIETMEAGPHPEQAGQIIERVRVARADILLVAYGAPEQELWIDRYGDDLRVPVMMGVGGAFDFVAGVTARAPLWAQRLGLEWLHRLWMQPWRWRRMLALPRFAWAILIRSNAIWTA